VKCPNYDSLKDGSCGLFSCMKSDECFHGWLTYWTEPERAGLKALGDGVIFAKENRNTKQTIYLAVGMVQAYVAASRTAKEWTK